MLAYGRPGICRLKLGLTQSPPPRRHGPAPVTSHKHRTLYTNIFQALQTRRDEMTYDVVSGSFNMHVSERWR